MHGIGLLKKRESAVSVNRKPNPIANKSKEKIDVTHSVDASGRKKTVIEPPVIPPIDNIPNERSRIVMRRFATIVMAKGVESLLQEFNELKISCPGVDQLNHMSFDRNTDKNRYKDIICVEGSRVALTWPPGMHDYVHANWATGIIPDCQKQIICTQAPLPNTIADFWRMVWQEKVYVILMLCQVIENGKKKCEQYWPLKPGETMHVAGLSITNERVDSYKPDLQYTKIIITGPGSDGTKRRHVLNHVLWDGWPDKGVPLSTTGALRLIFRTQTMTPAIVHCSAGVGRTGTIVALEMCMRVLASGAELSVYNIIKELRSRRFLACQTDLQYLYVHRAILQYITSKNIMSSEETQKWAMDYETLVKSRLAAGAAQ
uniref:Protein-tyrosine phosphatase n=1 Tax=Panagrellus redivivus TaxID=6233 RepID=A0A7E4UVT8_PANRE